MLAWSRRLTSGKDRKIVERYDCDAVCTRRGDFEDSKRGEYRCTRIDLAPVAWSESGKRVLQGGWMGRMRLDVVSMEGRPINPRQPPEDPDDGCPGGWYRSRFVLSIYPYLRRRTEHGDRVINMLLDRTEDELLLQWVQHVEDQQEAWESYRVQETYRDAH